MNPWTRDGNTIHLLVEGDLAPVSTEKGPAIALESSIIGPVSPNPFSSRTLISYNIGDRGGSVIRIFSMNGRVVFEKAVSGSGVTEWRAEGLPAGVYMIKADMAGRSAARKIVKLK